MIPERSGGLGRLVACAILTACGALTVCFAAGPAPAPSAVDPYALLQRIPSPYDLIGAKLPPAYRVPVELSGPVADEMRRMLDKMELSAPRFEEMMGRDRAMSLFIANDDYPLETRNLVSGILNPTDMIGLLLTSLLKYRDTEAFGRLRQETAGRLERTTSCGVPGYLVVLTPRNKRFSYTYEDAGSAVHEAWLIRLAVQFDAASSRVCGLSATRCARTVSAGSAGPASVDTAVMDYSFGYDTVNGFALPARLDLTVNGSSAVNVRATYRAEGSWLVFDQRSICCWKRGASGPSCLTMRYGPYLMGNPARVDRKAQVRGTYAQRLSKAATLSRKATDEIRRGNLSKAARVLKNLIETYPETPQAVEAEKVVQGLP